MQYIASFFGLAGPSTSNPNVFFYDSKEGQNIDLTNLTTANTVARKARGVLGFNGFMNTIRGRKDNKYYLPPLKYVYSRSSLIEHSTEIVKQTGNGILSGLSSIAETQSYAMAVDENTTVFIGEGSIPFGTEANALTLPAVRMSDTNCPYGQAGTVNLGIRYVHEGGNQINDTASVYSSVPACGSVDVKPTFSSVLFSFKLLQVAISASIIPSGGYGTPSLSQATSDGLLSQSQTGPDEYVTLDRAFCYLSQFLGFVKFDSNDFDAFDVVPGTRPRMRFKSRNLLV